MRDVLKKAIKVGVRATDREKSYRQTTWQMTPLAGASIPNSAYETVNVDGFPSYFVLKVLTSDGLSVK